MEQIRYRSLLPEPGETDAGSLLDSLPPGEAGHARGRPYTLANFVASADGRVTLDGRSGPLGDAGDRELFRTLRERADAVLAGTRTMALERYGRILPDPERRRRRLAAGRPAEPLACLVTRSGQLPRGIPLLAEPEAQVVVCSPEPPDLRGVAAAVRHEPIAPGPAPLSQALAALAERHGVELLLCEGGPTLLGGLLAERLLDELWLTLAPRLSGDATARTLLDVDPPLAGVELTLLAALTRDSSLYLRYRIDHRDPAQPHAPA